MNLEPTGGNMMRPHKLMVTSGQFWRCTHGRTDSEYCFDCEAVQSLSEKFAAFWQRVQLERIYLALRVLARWADTAVEHFPTNRHVQLNFRVRGIVTHDRILNKDKRQ